ARIPDSREAHRIARYERGGIGEPLVECLLVPCDSRTVQRIGITHESLGGARFASPNVSEARSGHVLVRFHRGTGRALLKDLYPALRVASRSCGFAKRYQHRHDSERTSVDHSLPRPRLGSSCFASATICAWWASYWAFQHCGSSGDSLAVRRCRLR